MSAPERGSYCIGLHELHLPTGAKPRLSTIYAGLRDRDHGSARWGEVLASLQDRAETARTTEMPRRSRAAELYRAAGVNPEAAFSDSRLVGFDAHDGAAVIAEHTGPSATFSIEVHSVLDGRHYVFEGEGSQASRYPAVRDGVLNDVSRYRPRVSGVQPPTDAFCTANGYFQLRDNEDVAGDAQLAVTFTDMPGVSFSLNIYGLVKASKELSFVERAARDLLELTSLGGRVKRLHSGKRSYGGQSGDIVAIRMASEDNDTGYDYKYFWHAAGRPMDAYAPEIEAELLAEGAHGLDQDALDALWAELMEGFRLRRDAR